MEIFAFTQFYAGFRRFHTKKTPPVYLKVLPGVSKVNEEENHSVIRPRNGREKALKTSYNGICNYFHDVIILFHDVEIYFLDVKINSHVEKIVLKAFFLFFIRLFGLFCKASLCFFTICLPLRYNISTKSCKFSTLFGEFFVTLQPKRITNQRRRKTNR